MSSSMVRKPNAACSEKCGRVSIKHLGAGLKTTKLSEPTLIKSVVLQRLLAHQL